jgi:hybrid cluster-associated redox disulfide protein
MKKITKSTKIAELIENYPDHALEIIETLAEAGLYCVGCPISTMETLEEGFLSYGHSKKELDELIKKLNKIIEKDV